MGALPSGSSVPVLGNGVLVRRLHQSWPSKTAMCQLALPWSVTPQWQGSGSSMLMAPMAMAACTGAVAIDGQPVGSGRLPSGLAFAHMIGNGPWLIDGLQ